MPGSQETNAMIVKRDAMDRRRFIASLSAVGLGGTAIPALLWSKVRQSGKITIDMLDDAEALSGLRFTEQEREFMLDGVNQNLERYQKLRTVEFPNSIHPAIRFDPVLPGHAVPTEQRAFRYSRPTRVARPSSPTDLAYARVVELAELVRTRQVSSVELTRMYLERLERHNPSLECVVMLTSDLAIKQARRADQELARGTIGGPCTGFRGAQRTCSRRTPTVPRGEPSRSSNNTFSRTRPSCVAWKMREPCWLRSSRSAPSPGEMSGLVAAREIRGISSRDRAGRQPVRRPQRSRGSSGSASGVRPWALLSRRQHGAAPPVSGRRTAG